MDKLKKIQENYGSFTFDFDSAMQIENHQNRVLLLNDVDSDSATGIFSYIYSINAEDEENNVPVEERKPIRLYIDSPGGDLFAGFMIIDTIKNSKTPVYTYAIGEACSCGGLVLMSGHKRYAYKHSTFCWHLGSANNGGDANKFINFSDFYRKKLEIIKDITLKSTKITKEQLALKERDDWWLDADEMLEYGIIDEIKENCLW